MTTSTRAASLPADERRSTIVAATIPLLVAHGDAVTTRQIAEATGVAEGTIFRVFPDKDSVIAAAIDAVLDPEPFEIALAGIDRTLPLPARLVEIVVVAQERVVKVWQLLSAVGPRHNEGAAKPMAESPMLVELLAQDAGSFHLPPRRAAQVLRSMTLALTHPLLAPEPLEADEIVALFLRGAHKECSSC